MRWLARSMLGVALLLCWQRTDAACTRSPLHCGTALTINGVPQHVMVRGAAGAPLLVIVHGGPGVNENPLFRQFVPALEQHFQVVYWEQRGTGRSYASRLDPATMTIPQFTRDLGELVEYVTGVYRQPQVLILAHSWGTIPGALYARAHPERVRAYIGIGQMADVPASELEGWRWAMEQARARDDRRALGDLQRIGPPPHTTEQMLVSRKWVERLGGTFHARLRTRDLIAAAWRDDHTGVLDLARFGLGNRFSLKHLWPQIRSFRLDATQAWDTPLVLMSGRHDRVTSYREAARFHARVPASCKRFVTFERSAHNPPFEEPQQFVAWLRDELEPWLATCVTARPRASGPAADARPPVR